MTELDVGFEVDPIAEALYMLRADGLFYCRSELTAPWGLQMPPMPESLWFHIVTSGRCILDDGEQTTTILPGDFVLVPCGRGHTLQSEVRVPCPDVTVLPQHMVGDNYSLLQHGGGGSPTTLICGIVRLDHPRAYELVDLLPDVIHLDASSVTHADWMDSTLRLMAAEAKELRPGGETVVARLADVLVVQAVRAWLQDDSTAHPGWLRALRDPQIGRAVALVHREPERAWTVASLASEAGMSRSGFAARFSQIVDESAMHYVTRVRMRVAEKMLHEENSITAGELASQLGYQSEAAFNRAFKRFVGVSPGVVKKRARAKANGGPSIADESRANVATRG